MIKQIAIATLIYFISPSNLSADTTQNENTENQLKKQIVRISENVYTTVDCQEASTSMIVGDNGVIIIDTLTKPKSAEETLREFRSFSYKPVKAIILTNNHNENIGGVNVFAKDSQDVPIYTAKNFGIPKGDAKYAKSIKKVIIAGVELEFFKVTGRTDDSLFIWLPKNKILFTGDNFYQVFPNFFAIKGIGYKDIKKWSKTVEQMVSMNPEHIITGHTMPISGKEAKIALLNYSDAIKYIYEDSEENINEGEYPNPSVNEIKLAENLNSKPNLEKFCEKINLAVKDIYIGLLAWFYNNPTAINPLSLKEKAQNLAKISGDLDGLTKAMQQAMQEENYQWALGLTETIESLDGANKQLIKETRIEALKQLAKKEYNEPKKRYYLSYVKELEKGTFDKHGI